MPTKYSGPKSNLTPEQKYEYMRAKLEAMVDGLVDDPEDFFVQEIRGDFNTVYEVFVVDDTPVNDQPAPAALVLGKHGTHANAVRTLMFATAKSVGGFKLMVDINLISRTALQEKKRVALEKARG